MNVQEPNMPPKTLIVQIHVSALFSTCSLYQPTHNIEVQQTRLYPSSTNCPIQAVRHHHMRPRMGCAGMLRFYWVCNCPWAFLLIGNPLTAISDCFGMFGRNLSALVSKYNLHAKLHTLTPDKLNIEKKTWNLKPELHITSRRCFLDGVAANAGPTHQPYK